MSTGMDTPQGSAVSTTPNVVVPPVAPKVDVEDLTWQLLDGVAEDSQVKVLERELIDKESARKTYVNCVQLHVDLMFYFREKQGDSLIVPLPNLTDADDDVSGSA